MTRQREAANFRAPVAKERSRVASLEDTPSLPGMEEPPEKPKVVRSDDLWRNAVAILRRTVELGGYTVQDAKLGHFVCTLRNGSERIEVSCKWQRQTGSWDEKIPLEVAKLAHAQRAYVVLVGPGCDKHKRDEWCSGLLDSATVRVVDYDFFAAAAWCQEL